MVISVPGLASQRKLLQMPFFSGSSAFFSGSQYVARRTHSVVVLPSYLSPYLRGLTQVSSLHGLFCDTLRL